MTVPEGIPSAIAQLTVAPETGDGYDRALFGVYDRDDVLGRERDRLARLRRPLLPRRRPMPSR